MLIQKYQEVWVDDFLALKSVFEDHLTTSEITIEHIGSTSIQGLAAKPIIDIDLIYEASAAFEEIKISLESLGYYHNGDQGISGREVFKRGKQLERHVILDTIRHHLYVCQKDSEGLQRHLAFRNYLRANDNKRSEYEKLKYEIADLANQDRKEYAKLKEEMAREFIESVIKTSTFGKNFAQIPLTKNRKI